MELVFDLVVIYLAIGVLFALGFLFFGVKRTDPAAEKGTWGFRILIFPGCVALWPLLMGRWVKGEGLPVERSAHRDAAKVKEVG